MKPAFIITLTLILSSQHIIAQTFRGTPVRYSDQALAAVLKNYQVYELPAADIDAYVHTRQFAIPITLEMGNTVFHWTLYENHILSPDVRGTTMKNGA